MTFAQFKIWLKKYDRPLSVLSLFSGFIFDAFTLRRIDLPLENAFLLLHLGFGAAAILWLHFYDSHPWEYRFFRWLRASLPYLIEFSFGGLFCALLIFYFRGAPLLVSWPFMVLLFGAFLAGEFGRKYYSNLALQLTLFFLGLYAFAIYHVPIVLHQMGAGVFLLSGVASLVGLVLFIMILKVVIPRPLRQNVWWITSSVATVFLLINLFYFTGILPPIPLSLKDSGLYQAIVRRGDQFVAVGEDYPWYETWWLFRPTLRLRAGDSAYFYSAVFAPTALATNLIHRWERYDETTRQWVPQADVPLSITGGREEGYRSYSLKTRPTAGLWRVVVRTTGGQTLGGETFYIETTKNLPVLKTHFL